MVKFQLGGVGVLLVLLSCGCTRAPLGAGIRVAEAPSGQKYSFLVSEGGAASVAQKVLRAMNSGDEKLLLAYAHPDEIRLLNLNPKILHAYENLYLKEKAGFEYRGMTEWRESLKGGFGNELLTHDDEEILIGCPVFSTPVGLRAYVTPTLVSAITQIRASKMRRQGAVPRGGPRGFTARLYTELRGKFEPYGVKGLLFNVNLRGDLQQESWADLIKYASRTRRPVSISMKAGN